MDIFDKFCDAVCDKLDYATYKESEGVRKELRDHLEDHAQALVDIGRSQEEARAAAVASMGNPDEIGRELNKHFPFIWLFLSRATVVIAVILAVMLLGPLRDIYNRASESLEARFSPMELFDNYGEPIDIRVELPESDIAYFYSYDIELSGDNDFRALIGLCVYDKNPLGRVSRNALDFRVELAEGFYQPSGGSSLGYGVHHKRMSIDVKSGQESIELCYSRLGNEIWVNIPLSWEGVK